MSASRESGPVALLGLRCSGKSSVGRALAVILVRPFVDLDQEVLEVGRHSGFRVDSAGALLETAGELSFREFEAVALRRQLEPEPRIVLATGGGVVERADNRAWLARAARNVYLSVPVETLRERLAADPTRRPALLGEDPLSEVAALFARRDPLYRSLAPLVIECGSAAPAELAERIRMEL